MRSATTWLALATCALACAGPARSQRTLPPLGDEGEVYVYLEPFPAEAGQLAFSLSAAQVARADAPAPLPLELLLAELDGPAMARQRLLAWGRLPPGDYGSLLLTVKRATLGSADGRSDLLVPTEPDRIPVSFQVERGRATLLSLTLQYARSVDRSFAFSPAFTAELARTPIEQLVGYCSSTALASLTAFDRHRHRALAVTPVGRAPEGVVLDRRANRAYVALSGEDQVEVLDLATGADLQRLPLRGGDQPRELALTPDGQLLVLDQGSYAVSFLDPATGSEVARVPTGEDPWSLRLDRSGRRAYVFNRRSNTVTVVDVPTRQVAATVPVDAEPLRGQVDRTGGRLYVVHGGSSYLTVLTLPDLTVASRLYVGLGASAVEVDVRTDRVYVAVGRTIEVFDPLSIVPIDSFELPGPASTLAVDEVENTLLAVLPDLRAVAFIDLTSRHVTGLVDVGESPYATAVEGELR